MILGFLLARKSYLLEKFKVDFVASKKLKIDITHGKEFSALVGNKVLYNGYTITIKIIKTGNYRVILSSIRIVDDLEKELYNVVIPNGSEVVDSNNPVFIRRTIPLENNPLLNKISSGSFLVLITDIEGKTYLGRPKTTSH